MTTLEHLNTRKAWRPCRDEYFNGTRIKEYVVEATFTNHVVAAAVIVHLASDGNAFFKTSKMHVELKDINDNYHKAQTNAVDVSCDKNPLVVHVLHDMTQPLFNTKAIRITFDQDSYEIAIASIGLRSRVLNVKEMDCNDGEIYSPAMRRCRKKLTYNMQCKNLEIKNAILNCSGNNDGDVCNVNCKQSYLPRDAFNVFCELGAWQNKKTCELITCPKPDINYALTGMLLHPYFIISIFKYQLPEAVYTTQSVFTCSS